MTAATSLLRASEPEQGATRLKSGRPATAAASELSGDRNPCYSYTALISLVSQTTLLITKTHAVPCRRAGTPQTTKTRPCTQSQATGEIHTCCHTTAPKRTQTHLHKPTRYSTTTTKPNHSVAVAAPAPAASPALLGNSARTDFFCSSVSEAGKSTV